MPNYNNDADGQASPIYESRPPPWLPKVSCSADLGYLGFYPPRHGQDEDLLSETNVKNGFVLGSQVSAETFSAQSILNIEDDTLSRLEALMNQVFVRRVDIIPPIPSSTFRIPTRVTLNDAKRQAWFADLANPEVPLHKLGKSVPHGAKGHDLLDLLHINNVAIPRAVWFLRVFGANETAGLRNKPSYNPVQYSIDWAGVVTSYMKKQLADIALPSAPRPGLNIKQTFKGVLSDTDTRDRWISRFNYCLKLLRTFYSEGLVDNRTFLIWVVQQQGSCNLAQTGFITRLADEYLEDILGSRALTRPLIDACLCRLSEIRGTSTQGLLFGTERLLQTILQRLCTAVPESFVSPKMWRAHSLLLNDILNVHDANFMDEKHAGRDHETCQILRDNFNDIKQRNEAMLFRNLSVQQAPRLGSAVADVKLLNSISSTTNIDTLHFFPRNNNNIPTFVEKLDVLLTWCVTPLQYGDHRHFAAVTLISNWRNREHERATRRGCLSPDELLQDRLFDWLDSSGAAGEPDNNHSVTLLYGRLINQELFSYTNYIQRLIARGEVGLSFTDGNAESRHRRFLRWIPLFKPASSLTTQRKATLYGTRAREIPEEAQERVIRREIRAVIPGLFGSSGPSGVGSTTGCPLVEDAGITMTYASIPETCPTLVSSPCFEQVRTLRHWLLSLLQKYISSQGSELDQTSLLNTYSGSVEIMDRMKCFETILELTLSLLEHTSTVDALNAVICTLHRFATIWACMGALSDIVASLDVAHQIWRARGIQFRPLLSLLLEFDNGEHLSIASRDRITADINAFTMALQPTIDCPDTVPDVLPEILLLAGDPDMDASSLLANSLWIKYRKSLDWAWKVWDNTVASLRQIPVMIHDRAGRRACALRYGTFLCHIDQHLPLGLDAEVSQWFLGQGKNEVAALGSDVWDVLTVVLLHLSVHGALKATTLLRGLVYPAWQQAAKIPAGHNDHNLEQLLRSANDLCRRLLISERINDDDMPPMNLLDLQSIRTRRQDVYHFSHFPELATSIPLLIHIENNEHVPQNLCRDSTSLRHSISLDANFRQGTYRDLEAIRNAFEGSSIFQQPPEDLSKRIIGGLRMLLSDVSDDVDLSDWPAISSLLSPWKIGATVIQLQLILKQMSCGVLRDASNETGKANLDKLIQLLFRHSVDFDAYYFGEIVRGVNVSIVGKFINNGLKCITEVLLESSPTTSKGFRQASELLRVLIYVAEPLREGSNFPFLDTSIQDVFLDALHTNITSLELHIAANERAPGELHENQDGSLLLRLLQFMLNFQITWNPKTKDSMYKITSSIFKLALTYGTSDIVDPVIYPLIIDTLYYIYDEIPSDSKSTSYDPFHNYPDFPVSELPPDLPLEYRQQLRSLLPRLDTTKASNLVESHRDPNGRIIHGMAVINRPWEWIENLGEPTISEAKDGHGRSENERFKTKYLTKNSGSLSLDVFGAQLTGDRILRNACLDPDTDAECSLHAFEDGLSAENIFRRDWRETRVIAEVTAGTLSGRTGNEIECGPGGVVQYATSRTERLSTSRTSPAPSLVSRGSVGPGWQSPGHGPNARQSTSTISDTLGTTMASARSLNKRKATGVPIADSGDEVEIVEGPVATSGKKSRGKAPSKARSKKK